MELDPMNMISKPDTAVIGYRNLQCVAVFSCNDFLPKREYQWKYCGGKIQMTISKHEKIPA